MREEALGHRGELGVGAVLEVVAAAVAVDRVARLEPGDRGADLLDHARGVPAEDHREVERERAGELALADLVVDRVQRRGADPHEHPVGRDRRRLDVEQLERLAPAPRLDRDRPHTPAVSTVGAGETRPALNDERAGLEPAREVAAVKVG